MRMSRLQPHALAAGSPQRAAQQGGAHAQEPQGAAHAARARTGTLFCELESVHEQAHVGLTGTLGFSSGSHGATL